MYIHLQAVGAIVLAPSTFMMYNWATSVEALKDLQALRRLFSVAVCAGYCTVLQCVVGAS